MHIMMQVRADPAPPPGACAKIIGRDRRWREIRLFATRNKMDVVECLEHSSRPGEARPYRLRFTSTTR